MLGLVAYAGWELRLQVRHHLLTMVFATSLAYLALLRVSPVARNPRVLTLLIFSDPALLGFLFVGGLVLVEKHNRTLDALCVTPLGITRRLWGRCLALTLLAVLGSTSIAISGRGFDFQFHWLLLGTVLTSFTFVMLGFVGVSRVESINQYLLIVPAFLTPMALPLLEHVGLVQSVLFYLIPSHAALLLLRAAFEPVPLTDMVYAVLYLTLSCALAAHLAKRSFQAPTEARA